MSEALSALRDHQDPKHMFLPPIVGVHFVNGLQPNSAAVSELRIAIISAAERTKASAADPTNKV